MRQFGKRFHNLDLHGIETAPDHCLGEYPAPNWRRFADASPADLRGKSVLDIRCNGGFYAIEMKHRGADCVVGIYEDATDLAQARFAAEVSEGVYIRRRGELKDGPRAVYPDRKEHGTRRGDRG